MSPVNDTPIHQEHAQNPLYIVFLTTRQVATSDLIRITLRACLTATNYLDCFRRRTNSFNSGIPAHYTRWVIFKYPPTNHYSDIEPSLNRVRVRMTCYYLILPRPISREQSKAYFPFSSALYLLGTFLSYFLKTIKF